MVLRKKKTLHVEYFLPLLIAVLLDHAKSHTQCEGDFYQMLSSK